MAEQPSRFLESSSVSSGGLVAYLEDTVGKKIASVLVSTVISLSFNSNSKA